jgi:hypothetical protein
MVQLMDSSSPKLVGLKESDGFPWSYFFGHHHSYGLNCQAICKSRLMFPFFSVIVAGQTNDAVAYKQTFKFAYPAFIAGNAVTILLC